MIFLTTIAVGLLTILFLVFRSLYQRWIDRQTSLEIHNSLRRRVYGCIACGIELYPGDTFYLCGHCGDGLAESFSWCPRCYKSLTHKHHMYKEPVPLEVDPAPISAAGSSREALMTALTLYAPRLCLGHRPLLPGGGFSPEYTWLTYSDVSKKIATISNGLGALGFNSGECVVLWGASSVEWFLAYFTCLATGMPLIPVQSSVSASYLAHIVQLARPSLVITSRHLQVPLTQALSSQEHSVRTVVLLDDLPSPYALQQGPSQPQDLTTRIVDWIEVLALGRQHKRDIPPPVSPTDTVAFLPSSGTTGPPRLTSIPEAILRRSARAPTHPELVVMLAYDHLREALTILCQGGRIGVFSGSMDTISEDLVALRPTRFNATAAFWNDLHQSFTNELASEQIANPADSPTEIYTRLRTEWRARKVLGNRCRYITINGPKPSESVRDWIFNVLGCVVVDN